MTSYPWTPERELSLEQAAQLVRTQFPEIPCKTVAPLGEGWDFFVFVVDDSLAFRFPKKAAADRCIACELAILERLPENLPIAVPRPLYQGVAAGDYPWRFWGYRMLPGESLDSIRVPEKQRALVAESLGRFLSILHGIDGRGLPRSPWEDDGPGWPHMPEVRAALEASREIYPAALFTRCLEYLLSPDRAPSHYRGEPKPVHGDLLPEHILVDPRTFLPSGIIDWGDATLGDPAVDFVGLWMWGGDSILEAALAAYASDLDPAARRRIRHKGTLIAMEDVHYGVIAKRQALVRAGLETLTRELLR